MNHQVALYAAVPEANPTIYELYPSRMLRDASTQWIFCRGCDGTDMFAMFILAL